MLLCVVLGISKPKKNEKVANEKRKLSFLMLNYAKIAIIVAQNCYFEAKITKLLATTYYLLD